MGAGFKDIKVNIIHAIGKNETPEAIVKTCLDAICLMKMIYGIDLDAVAKKLEEHRQASQRNKEAKS